MTIAYDAQEDFAGPGGWDEGAKMIGLRLVGIEHDHDACRTAVAAGHARIRADVAAYPSEPFRGVRGHVSSPPCTLFSSAGTGVGKLVLDVLANGIRRIFAGDDCRAEIREAIYPVTLAAAREKNAKRKPDRRWTEERVEEKARDDAFVATLILEPARRIMELDPEWVALEQVPDVLPLWLVYARELRARGYSAWAMVLCAADYGVAQTRRRACLGASRVRMVAPPPPTHAEHDVGADLLGSERIEWVTLAKALNIPESAIVRTGQNSDLGRGRVERYNRTASRPAPVLMQNAKSWRLEPAAGWIFVRPATTIVGSFKPEIVAAPGYRTSTSRQDADGSVLVEVHEAGILQSFPADYPWHGCKSKRFEQVGNAIPPLLAAHILGAVA